MTSPGKSQPPKPLRDNRVDSTPPAGQVEEFRPGARVLKPARDPRQEDEALELAAMLVRVADTERARDVSEKRATGLESWTLELEAKVAAERTRADEKEAVLVRLGKELDAVRAELEATKRELATARREGEEALEAERVKRGLEIDTLIEQHQLALVAARTEGASSRGGAAFDAMAKMVKTLEEVEALDSQARALRAGVLLQAKRALSTATPPAKAEAITQTAITIPPITKRKRSKRPPVPPPPPVPTATPITKPGEQLESFDDLELE